MVSRSTRQSTANAMDVDEAPSLQPIDRLLLAQAVWELGANSWPAVAKLLTKHPLLHHPKSFFTAQSCHAMYDSLMKEAGLDGAGAVDAIHAPIHLQLAQKHYQARVNELRDLILAEETKYKLLVAEIDTIRNDNAKSSGHKEVDNNSRQEVEVEEVGVTAPSPHGEEPTTQAESTPAEAVDDIRQHELHTEQEDEERHGEQVQEDEAQQEAQQEDDEIIVQNVDVDIPLQEDTDTAVTSPPPVEEALTKEPSRSPSPPSPPSPELGRDPSILPGAQGQDAKEADTASTGSPPLGDVPMEQDHVDVEAPRSPQGEDLPEDIDQSMGITDGDGDQVPPPSGPNAGVAVAVAEEDESEPEPEPTLEDTTKRESSPSSVTTRSNTSPFEVQPMVVDEIEVMTKGSEPADVQEDDADEEPAESPTPQDDASSHRREGKRKASSIESPAESVRDRKRPRDGSEPLDEEETGMSSSGPSRRKGNRQTDEQLANKRFQNVIGLLHSQISQHRNGTIFHNPIKNSEAPDYHEIVKRPMDLKTIKARIKDGAISNSLEFQRDIYLMFANAMMYNRPGSDIYSMAEDMMLESEDFIHSFRQTEGFVRGTQGHRM